MKTRHLSTFEELVSRLRGRRPLSGHLNLTYRCNYDCVHCYCKGSEKNGTELSFPEIRRILDEARALGCVWLTLSGGECLLRPDFPEIYLHAKKNGFLISVFTNGSLLDEKIRKLLAAVRPFSVEVTLNGATEKTYAAVTGVKGQLRKVLSNIMELRRAGVSVMTKSNLLKLNMREVASVKAWADRFLGKPADNRYLFGCDQMIYPRLNGDASPCALRLSVKEIGETYAPDADLAAEWKGDLAEELPAATRANKFLYDCNTWKTQFIVDPFGRLKFCAFSDRFSADLRKTSLKDGFYKGFSKVGRAEFKTGSKCRDCRLRVICGWCPARAFLETGNEESPVPFYCARGRDLIRFSKSGCATNRKRGKDDRN